MTNKMAKSSKEKTRGEQARKIAVQLVKARKQLLVLRRKLTETGAIDEGRRQEAIDLITKINNYKQQLIEMGLDPKEAAKWAVEQNKTKRKGKRLSVKRPRGSGIGMYGLGNSVKIWR